MHRLFLLLLLSSCDQKRDCPPAVACPAGTRCACDEGGRLVEELRDPDGDGVVDRLEHRYDEAGRLIATDTDFRNNERLDRRQEFAYDDQGRRTAISGFNVGCGGSKLTFECRYSEPCPAPFDRCGRCLSKLDIEKRDGTIKPCADELQPDGGS